MALFIIIAALCFWANFKKMGFISIALAVIIPGIMALFGKYSYPIELMQSYGIYLPFHEISNYIPFIAIGGVVLCALLMFGARSTKSGGKVLIITIGFTIGLFLMYIIEAVFFIKLLDSGQVIVIEIELGVILAITLITIIKRKIKNDEKEKGKESANFMTYFSTPTSYYSFLTALMLIAHIGLTFTTGNIYLSIFIALVLTFAFVVVTNGKVQEMMQDIIRYATGNISNYLAKIQNSKNQEFNNNNNNGGSNPGYDTDIDNNLGDNDVNYDNGLNIINANYGNENVITESVTNAMDATDTNNYSSENENDIFETTTEFFDFIPNNENENENKDAYVNVNENENMNSNESVNENPNNLTSPPHENNQDGEDNGYNQAYEIITSLLKRFIVQLFRNNRIELSFENLELLDCVEEVCNYFNNFTYLELPDISEPMEKLKVLDKFLKNHGILTKDLLNGVESNCVNLKQLIVDSLTIIINDSQFTGEDGS